MLDLELKNVASRSGRIALLLGFISLSVVVAVVAKWPGSRSVVSENPTESPGVAESPPPSPDVPWDDGVDKSLQAT